MKQKIILIIICILNVYNVCSQTIQELKRQAETNDPAALWNVGCAYYNGTNGVSVNYTEALKWYTLAANSGYVDAMKFVSDMYYHGQGTEENHTYALEWAKKAAIAGDIDSQRNTALLYYKGDGTEKNLEEAFYWQKKVAENKQAQKEELFRFGIFFLNGIGCTQNFDEAIRWFKKAADSGYTQAYSALGDVYGYQKKYSESNKYYLSSG